MILWAVHKIFFKKNSAKKTSRTRRAPGGAGGSRKKLLKKPGKQKGDLPVARPWELKKKEMGFVVAWGLLKLVMF